MNNVIGGYDTEEAQKALAQLPDGDRKTLYMFHRVEADAINNAMNLRVGSIMKDTSLKPSDTVEIAGVRMNRGYLKPPTAEEIIKLGFHELKDEEEPNPEIPEYHILVIDDFYIFKRIFPYYSRLTEDKARKLNLFPHEVGMLNKKAQDSLLEHRSLLSGRKERRLTDEEAGKIMQYARKKGNNILMKEMGSGYLGYRNNRSVYHVCDRAFFSIDDGSSYIWLDRDCARSDRLSSVSAGNLIPVLSVSEEK